MTASLSELTTTANPAPPDSCILALSMRTLSNLNTKLPIRIGSFIVILPTAGSGSITIDLNEYHLRPDEIILLQPASYICGYELSPDFDAEIIVCREDNISSLFPTDALTDISGLLTLRRAAPAVKVAQGKREILKSFFTILKNYIDAQPSPLNILKQRLLVASAIAETIDVKSAETSSQHYGFNRKEWLMARFVEAVSHNFKQERQVSFYAKELGITPKHLSTVVKSMSGKTAGEWIEAFVIMEAKVLLLSTDLPVREIASMLNFPNQSFFGKYFKHISGWSPTQFRIQFYRGED